MSDFEVPARAAGPSRPSASLSAGQPAGPPAGPSVGAAADLAAMRVRYVPGPLLEADLPAEPVEVVRAWLSDAVDAGLPEPNAMVVSTVEPDGRPRSRHVLLKEVDGTGFVFYTNLGSRKARAIAANPAVGLCFPWFAMSRQVTVVGRAEAVDRATAAAYWAARPRESQLGAWASRQSEPVPSREALHAQLAETAARFPEPDAVPLPQFWGGIRVVPDSVELWQGQPGRMHDRLVYTRTAADPRSASPWTVTRLQP